MKKAAMFFSLLFLMDYGLAAEPIVKTILRAAFDPQNSNLVAGMAVRIKEDSDISYDVAEEIYIKYPGFTLPEIEDEFDLIVPLQDAFLVGDALLLREQTIGMVVHIALEDIAAAFPIIQTSSAFRHFVEQIKKAP